MVDMSKPRKRRANGEESRRKILDAAEVVASERGYDGTSIALVSKKSGLPASSIYWHFKDKDDLVAAVIERSFGTWLAAVAIPDGDDPREQVSEMSIRIVKSLLDTPHFLRLGLMLALERRPEELRARTAFLEVRDRAFEQISTTLRDFMPGLDDGSVRLLTTYAISAADGLFIAREIGGDAVDLVALFDLHARVVYDAAARLKAEVRTRNSDSDTETEISTS